MLKNPMLFARLTSICLLFCALTSAPAAFAEDATSTLNTNAWDPMRPFFDLRYEAWVYGPSFRAMDGRDGGPGASLAIDHFVKAGYYLGDGWKIRLYQPFTQTFAHPTLEYRSWTAGDPSVGFGKAGILKDEVHGVEWRLIGYYAVPISSYTKKNIGGDFDRGDGRITIESKIGLNRLTSPLWMDFRWIGFQMLKKHPTPYGLEQRFELYNKVGIVPTQKTDLYVGYNNYINWYRNDYQDPWKKHQALELGGTYYFTPDTYLNPFLETPFHLRDTKLWLYFETRFI